jgi:hypothetical protein
MRCLTCGAEMCLEQAARDDTMLVPSFERRVFKCLSCGDIERRLGFTKHVNQVASSTSCHHTSFRGALQSRKRRPRLSAS